MAEMAEAESLSTLHRKMSAGRSGSTVSGRALLRALRLATARAAHAAFELPLQVIGATQDRRHKHDLDFGEDGLLVVLDGADGQIGMATLDASCVMALIQHQTMGRVLGGEPTQRPLTATDAAMAAPLLDELFIKATDLVEGETDRRCLGGFAFGALVDDPQSLLLMLDADQIFRAFELTLEFTEAPCQGCITLVLPEPQVQSVDPESGGTAGAGAMQKNLGAIRADLRAIVGRTKIPLSVLSSLREGDMLPIDNAFLDRAELWSIDGRCVTVGRLGQMTGMRAIRVNEPGVAKDKSVVEDGVGFSGQDIVTRKPSATPAAPVPKMPEAAKPGSLPARPAESGLPELDSLEPSTWDEAKEQFQDDNDISNLSTSDAAAEISKLAGLDGTEEEAQGAHDLPDAALMQKAV